MTYLFKDRIDAGKRLAAAIGKCDPEQTVVVGLPRGGVPVAAEVAKAIGAPLDLIFVRKIGAPGHEELALGAVADGAEPEISVNMDVAASYGLTRDEVRQRAQPLLKEIERRRQAYLEGRPALPLEGKTVFLVDDGMATGASAKAALRAIRRHHPKRLVLAVPVAPADTLTEFDDYADQVICLEVPQFFVAVGPHYQNFSQTTDEQVRRIMRVFTSAPTTSQSVVET